MWDHRTVRLRPDAQKLISYLQYNIDGIRPSELVNAVLVEKLPELYDRTYIISDYPYTRPVKGYKLAEDTIQDLDKYLASHKNHLKAEVFEICLNLFAVEHLSEDEKKIFKLDSWNVRVKE